MQYINNNNMNIFERNALAHVNTNNLHLKQQQQQQFIAPSQWPGSCNENMDPSQNQKFVQSKSAINNIENALSSNKQNLYLRRQHNSISQNLNHLSQQPPPLKVEIASNAVSYSALSSANSSYIVNNEESFVLSSASSITHSASLRNGYLSRSRSLSEINFPYINKKARKTKRKIKK